MKVTTKGQVTIPLEIREKLKIRPHAEVDFVEEGGRVYLVKRQGEASGLRRFHRFRGAATVRMSTDEIMALTRNDA